MSITVDYAFNSDLALPDLAFEINRRLGCSLACESDGDGDVFSGGFFGMYLSLCGPHSLVNDGGVNFEDYRYLLGNTTWAASSMRTIQLEVIALTAFFLHTSLAIHRGMLTFNVGILLARYEPSKDGWYDLVGDKRVTYPDHLVDLKARIPNPEDRGLI